MTDTDTDTGRASTPTPTPLRPATDTFDVALPVRTAREIARDLDLLVEFLATNAGDPRLRLALADHYRSQTAADWLSDHLGHWAHTLRTARPTTTCTPAPAPAEGLLP
jgi:hypothetical protein